MSRNSKTPCGYLIQNKKCQTINCDFAHDTWTVQRWRNLLDVTKTCKHGEHCIHNQDGNCFYYHPPEHQNVRPVMAISGMAFLEALHLDTLLVDKAVCVEDEYDLASFNKLADNEIAVPGKCQYSSNQVNVNQFVTWQEFHLAFTP